MKYNPRIHHRRSTRLKGYNYAKTGKYFVTLNCKNGIHLFGEIVDGKMILNEFGIIAQQEWLRTPEIRPNIELGVFVIMPDHVHGIIIIKEDVSGWSSPDEFINFTNASIAGLGVLHPPRPAAELSRGGCNTPRLNSGSTPQSFLSPSQTLGAIMRGYMGTVTSQINKIRDTPGEKVWQRGLHDHIIRSKRSYHRITNYIIRNPKNFNKRS